MVSRSFTFTPILSLGLLGALCFTGCDPEPELTGDGGMWLPSQLDVEVHQAAMEELGLEALARSMTNPQGKHLGSVVRAGRCTGSFVSSTGLIVTNQHCVDDELTRLSKEGEDLLRDGFVAQTLEDERAMGPGFQTMILAGSKSVTDEILAKVTPDMNPVARVAAIREARGEVLKACQDEHPGYLCDVKSFYSDNKFRVEHYRVISDTRLVYAPPVSVGFFGGDDDNFEWPRHAGDFAFIRAYDANGEPYKPEQHLTVSVSNVNPGDPVVVAGYPGRTSRWKSNSQAYVAFHATNPNYVTLATELVDIMNKLSAEDPSFAKRFAPTIFSLNNARKHAQGEIDADKALGVVRAMREQDLELQSWINETPQAKRKYGNLVKEMSDAFEGELAKVPFDIWISQFVPSSIIVQRADKIVQEALLREQGKTTTPQDVENMKAWLLRTGPAQPKFGVPIMSLVVRHLRDLQPKHQIARAILGLGPDDPVEDADIDKRIADFVKATPLLDDDAVLELFEKASVEELKEAGGFLGGTLAFHPYALAAVKRTQDRFYEESALNAKFASARLDYLDSQAMLAPADANRSLRVTYGQVQGYLPSPDAKPFSAMTTAEELLAKHTGKAPFDLPEQVRTALGAKDFGRYLDPELNDLPVNFLASLDTTGGNSGSPALNARGELVGVAFDGNYEGLSSDWFLHPEITRTISVDARFMLWYMDVCDPAHRLLEELGIKPTGSSVKPSDYKARRR